uniref:Organic solute transporter subunit alpha-like n=1 Tax=Leptobrachium leishanense TaxID=445787 RepID=A0A8C5P947_9ANUR
MENGTDTVCRTRIAPYAHVIIDNLDGTGLALFSLLTAMTAIALLIFLDEAYYMYKKVHGPRKTLMIWINGSAPVITIAACVGMWIPRSSMITDLTASVFLAVFIHKFQLMMVRECGGKNEFLRKFGNQKLQLSTGPCCCCCICLPRKDIHSRTIFVLKLGTFQFAFLKITLMFLAIVMWTDDIFNVFDLSPFGPALWFNIIYGVSTVLALWSVGIMFNLVRHTLSDTNIIPKFVTYQCVVILTQLQTAIINILGNMGIFPCSPPLPGPARASYVNQQLLIMEMFMTTLLFRLLYRRKYETLSNEDDTDNLQSNILDVNGNAMEGKLQYA